MLEIIALWQFIDLLSSLDIGQRHGKRCAMHCDLLCQAIEFAQILSILFLPNACFPPSVLVFIASWVEMFDPGFSVFSFRT